MSSVCEKCSHWLKGHSFTVWTNNNPLTYIMTKPKRDACEQRWLAKLSPYTFNLKHIPGAKNTVTDALSRDPFARTVSQRLISQPYEDLMAVAEETKEEETNKMFKTEFSVTKDPSTRQKRHQFVLLASLKVKALTGVYDLARHQGQARTLHLARQHFFWPQIERDIKDYVKCCQRCILSKTPEPSALLLPWSCYALISGSQTKISGCLGHNRPFHKNGSNCGIMCSAYMVFQNECIQTKEPILKVSSWQLLSLTGITMSHTTAYHPMRNGQTERFNRMLGSMLRALPLSAEQHWAQQIQTLTFNYNATIHETTRCAPFYLMYGRASPEGPSQDLHKETQIFLKPLASLSSTQGKSSSIKLQQEWHLSECWWQSSVGK